MSDTPPQDSLKPLIDLKKTTSWKDDLTVGFEHRAPLTIAGWVLGIFGGVYSLSFVAMFFLFFRTDATFGKGAELIKFLVQSLLPLVTLAVGYYLGDRNRHSSPPKGRK